MIVVVALALILIGVAVALVTSAVLEPRIRRSENLSQIDAYGQSTNMLQRADDLLKAATHAYSIGATSLLDLLEAQRAYINTRIDYLEATAVYRQALADLENARGGLGIFGDKEITP